MRPRPARFRPRCEGLEDRRLRTAGMMPLACPIDLVLVLDGSQSVASGAFEQQRQIAVALVSRFTIGDGGAHVGVVQFASMGAGVVEVGLTGQAGAVSQALAAMSPLEGGTDIQEGLALARAEFAARGRAGAPQVIVLMTDGLQTEGFDPVVEADAFKAAGGLIFVIGVGALLNLDRLVGLASSPAATFVRVAAWFSDFDRDVDALATTICDAAGVEPPIGTEPEPPVVLHMAWANPRWTRSSLIITYSQPMNPAQAASKTNYILTAPGRDRRFGTRDDQTLPLATVVYDASSHAVTLVPRKRLPLTGRYRLRILGPTMTSESGVALDGANNRTPGTDYLREFGRELAVPLRPTLWPRAGR